MQKATTRKRGEGSLITRGKAKNYYLQYRIDGRQAQTRLLDENDKPVTDRRKAEKAANSFLAPLKESGKTEQLKAIKAKLEDEETKHAAIIAAARPTIPLSKVWTAYEQAVNRPQSGQATLNRYHAHITTFAHWMNEVYPDIETMRDVTAAHAEAYAIHLKAKRLSPSTFNICLNNLSTVWGVLAKKADISENPFAWDKATRSGIPRKNIKAESNARKKRALTLGEINSVLEHATGDYRTLIVILACTGQRLVDCVKLQWRSIDEQAGIICLTPQKTAKRTGTEVLIPVLPQLRTELKNRSNVGRYVLPELVAIYNRDPSAITKQMRNIFEAAGIQVHKADREGRAVVEVGAHSFRYSFVSIARLAGVPDTVIQSITGHESIAMVDHYTIITPETVQKLSASFDDQKLLPSSTIPLAEATPECEPLPDWVREKLEIMTAENFEQIKANLLKG